jgi:nucleoside-diphosphate-sugar epimerase
VLLVFGLGYTGRAIAGLAAAAGWRVIGTSRTPDALQVSPGVDVVAFERADEVVPAVTHVLETAPPEEAGDPALIRHGAALRAARPVWAGLLSTTGVYGDRGGAWVDEDTEPAPTGPRGARRFEQERQWTASFPGCAVDLFRVAGIYGPGRSPLDDVRARRARRVDRPGQMFGRIHRDDIAGAVWAAMRQARGPGARVLNLTDDEPAANADVVAHAAALLGAPPPPLVPFEQALAAMSPMGRSFWAENRRVASRKTQAALGYRWRYPDFRAGLQAVLDQERAEGLA